jgi:hypothetical protein
MALDSSPGKPFPPGCLTVRGFRKAELREAPIPDLAELELPNSKRCRFEQHTLDTAPIISCGVNHSSYSIFAQPMIPPP